MKKYKFRSLFISGLIGLVSLCLVLIGISVISNRNLPTHSSSNDRLSELDKARLSETIQMRKVLGENVWPGWSKADVPLIV